MTHGVRGVAGSSLIVSSTRRTSGTQEGAGPRTGTGLLCLWPVLGHKFGAGGQSDCLLLRSWPGSRGMWAAPWKGDMQLALPQGHLASATKRKRIFSFPTFRCHYRHRFDVGQRKLLFLFWAYLFTYLFILDATVFTRRPEQWSIKSKPLDESSHWCTGCKSRKWFALCLTVAPEGKKGRKKLGTVRARSRKSRGAVQNVLDVSRERVETQRASRSCTCTRTHAQVSLLSEIKKKKSEKYLVKKYKHWLHNQLIFKNIIILAILITRANNDRALNMYQALCYMLWLLYLI